MHHTAAREGERGFTLIELMIVVAIIAILAGILIPNFVNARAQAQTAACESNLRSIATALELYYADNQVYPTASGAPVVPALLTANSVAYLNNTPKDPAAQNDTATYSLTTTQATSGSPRVVHDPVPRACTPARRSRSCPPCGRRRGTLCGTNCAATKIEYVAGQGLEASL